MLAQLTVELRVVLGEESSLDILQAFVFTVVEQAEYEGLHGRS